MKTFKKPHQRPTPPPIALTPRQIALRKVYRVLTVVGGIGAFLGIATLFTLYGRELITPRLSPKLASAKDLEIEPKINENNRPSGDAPAGMVWVPGGLFYMGIDDAAFDDADLHGVYVDGFWMDKTEVTNEQFAKFVDATKYVTDAEKPVNPRDFPEVPAKEWTPEKLKPFSIVFECPRPGEYDLATHQGWWDARKGACWKHPEGPKSTIKGREKYPVVHISYNDAIAYCNWAKRRLPTEAEWEFAARGGLDRKLFPWGDEPKPDGKWMCNIWQGKFPVENTREDGFEGAAPVGSFPPNAFGLHDMSGNVWEWCADWYQATYYMKSPRNNPKGPDSGFDLSEVAQKRVQRGGSFLCADNYCVRYVLGTRGKGEIGSSANHIGFRCVKDAK
ncbi:MAG TPA: formylglycine-generating enzyme family protein [Gemmataceae bacterium]|nr:formylglycine-generating enzyme family protein [Gemmataceae bacterium]